MKPRVSVPKIFLRGSRWYVRVQVPKEMQSKLRRKEYWVSLQTSDRTEALQRATAATQKKRREISSVYRRLAEIKETIHELTPDQQTSLGREAYTRHVERRVDVVLLLEAHLNRNGGNHHMVADLGAPAPEAPAPVRRGGRRRSFD